MILRDLGRFVHHFHSRDLPADAWHAAKRCLVDWAAATIPGGLQPPATLLDAALADERGRSRAVLLPAATPMTPRAAALINGCAAHTIEFDDIYRDGIYHPGAPTIAAALAAAQATGASGDLFLRAVIAGYELATRIAVVVNPAHYEFWHTTGTVGTFGAAAAAAVLLRLDAEQCTHALATSGTLAAGLQQAFRAHSMSKPLHSGHAAETGLLAALGAGRGVTGALDILEGPRGFGAAMSHAPDFSRLLDDADRFNITRMTVKNYSCCGHTFAAVDAARELRARTGLAASDIAALHVATYGKALEVAGNPNPQSAFEAQFSIPYCVSVAFHTGSARLDAFTEARLADPTVRALVERVRLAVDPAADAAYPRQRAATVTLQTRSGREETFHAPTRKGDPDYPLSDEDLDDKFRELVTPVFGAAPTAALLATLWHVDALPDLAALPVPAVVHAS